MRVGGEGLVKGEYSSARYPITGKKMTEVLTACLGPGITEVQRGSSRTEPHLGDWQNLFLELEPLFWVWWTGQEDGRQPVTSGKEGRSRRLDCRNETSGQACKEGKKLRTDLKLELGIRRLFRKSQHAVVHPFKENGERWQRSKISSSSLSLTRFCFKEQRFKFRAMAPLGCYYGRVQSTWARNT